ncbi:hypothetical protein AgCh_022033 [Apium graveolens]
METWPDFAESSEAANQQVFSSLEPLYYLVVASLAVKIPLQSGEHLLDLPMVMLQFCLRASSFQWLLMQQTT